MDAAQAQRVIESLRKGIPPDGFVRQFTVGRDSEICALEAMLNDSRAGALLLKANYGSGKTHLLRFIKEVALEKGFAVSHITLDSSSAVRFNRMDQIFGTVTRCIEVPNKQNKGPAALFESVLDAMTSPCSDTVRKAQLDELSSLDRWDYSTTLKSPAMYIALRAWNYYSQSKWLYDRFVGGLRRYFRDPRGEWQLHRCRRVNCNFRSSDYHQSWDALADLNLLANLAGLKGVVLLVDEFEDVLYNLKNINYQQDAFWNLFQLFDGKFPGFSFYAVTPAFVKKCKDLLHEKGIYDFDFSRFDSLPTFELSPPSPKELRDLCSSIIDMHYFAYNWETTHFKTHSDFQRMIENLSQQPIQDRTRVLITSIVKILDSQLQDYN
jgi:hypothetical protein